MKNKSYGGYFWGIILVLLGVVFLIDNLTGYDFSNIIGNYWPVILILLGIGDVISGKWTSAIFWLGLGIILLLNQLNIFNFDVWALVGPFILIIIGIRILIRPSSNKIITSDKDNFITASAIFGGENKKVNSKAFAGANINAIFGGTSLDLRNATISKDGATIDVLAVFGGADIIVRNNMPVKIEVTSIFGGSEDKRSQGNNKDKSPVIRIQGMVLFGGFSVKEKED